MPILSYSKTGLIIQIAGCPDSIMESKAIIPICCSEIMKINDFGRMNRESFHNYLHKNFGIESNYIYAHHQKGVHQSAKRCMKTVKKGMLKDMKNIKHKLSVISIS